MSKELKITILIKLAFFNILIFALISNSYGQSKSQIYFLPAYAQIDSIALDTIVPSTQTTLASLKDSSGSFDHCFGTPPQYKGGSKKMIKYFQSNFKIQDSLKHLKIEGLIIVSFIVDTTGKVTNAKIIKGLRDDLDSEAVRVITSMPDWLPGGYLPNELIPVRFTWPLKFNIKGKRKSASSAK